MSHPSHRLALSLIAAVLLASACTTKKQEIPALTGPSELSTSINISLSSDVLFQDGASQSLVTITARDHNGQPLRNLPLRVEIAVDGFVTDFGTLSARNVVTDANGRATVTYTAPPAPGVSIDTGTIVQIRVTPLGNDFGNATPRFATIRLTPPGVIGAPPSPFVATFAPPSATVGNAAIFSASVKDAAGNDAVSQVSSFSWNFGDGETATGQVVSHVYDTAGTYSVTLTVTDFLGRVARTSGTVTVGQGQIPVASFLASPTSPNVGQPVNFNATGSTAEPGHSIRTYSWNFGDGTTADTGALTSHTYEQAGTYTVALKVTDDAGRKSTLTTQSITVGAGSPTASFTSSPTAPTTSTNINFDASPSTAAPGRTIVSYTWSWGDGSPNTTTTQRTTTHRFTAAGTYIVRLTVTDDQGRTGTTTSNITVTP